MAENIQAISIRDILGVIFKHKTKILTVFFVIVAIVAVGSFAAKPTYEANSKILIKFGRENIYIPATGSGSTPLVSINREETINSEIEILNSRDLIESTIKKLGIENVYPELVKNTKSNKNGGASTFEKAVLLLPQSLQIEGVKKSDIINVKFQHYDPHIAANVINTLVNFFLEHHLKVHNANF